nr:DNA mismatch repair protein MutL [Ferruginibacter sp.]
ILEQYKHFSSDLKYSRREKLLRSMALQQSIKPGTPLSDMEMKQLVEDLFQCSTPNATANGKPTYLEFRRDELDKLFGK